VSGLPAIFRRKALRCGTNGPSRPVQFFRKFMGGYPATYATNNGSHHLTNHQCRYRRTALSRGARSRLCVQSRRSGRRHVVVPSSRRAIGTQYSSSRSPRSVFRDTDYFFDRLVNERRKSRSFTVVLLTTSRRFSKGEQPIVRVGRTAVVERRETVAYHAHMVRVAFLSLTPRFPV